MHRTNNAMIISGTNLVISALKIAKAQSEERHQLVNRLESELRQANAKISGTLTASSILHGFEAQYKA